MDKCQCIVLLPLTLKDTGNNPVGYPLMVFESDPNLAKGELKALTFENIDFYGLVLNRSESLENGTHVTYTFEIQNRDLALEIAKLVKDSNPGVFAEDNFIS